MSTPPSAARITGSIRIAFTVATWGALAAIILIGSIFSILLAVPNAGDATREVLFNVGHWVRWLLYASTLGVFVFPALGPARRSAMWRLGRPEKRGNRLLERSKVFLKYGIGQGRMANDLYAGTMHLFIFWGWLVLFAGTLVIAVHADLVYFLEGRVYLAYSAILDLFGVVALIGLVMAILRRVWLRPGKLRLGSLRDDAFLLWLMVAIVLTGFLIEAMRIGATELTAATIEVRGAAFPDDFGIAHNQKSIVANPDWAPWSPVGYGLAKASASLGMSTATMLDVHKIIWWAHLPMALAWTAWIGCGKISHIVQGSANILMRSLSSPKGKIAGSSLAPIVDFEASESFGAGHLADFSWKQLMDADVCVRCGRCEVNCPAHITGKELSPMVFLQGIKDFMTEAGPGLIQARKRGEGASAEDEPLIAGDIISDNTIWDCVTCGACETQCPLSIEHIGTLQDMRRYKVLTEGAMSATAQATLTQIEQRGHPWRGTSLTRTSWMEDLDVPAFDGSQEYLFWVGCSGALVERNLPITRAVARLLNQAEVNWGCLGEAETCSGDPARRLGNEYLAQMQIQATIANLSEKKVQKVITNCPHCLNAFRNEYPAFGGEFETHHHSEILETLLALGRLQPQTSLDQQITYHDSCYLGRYNGEYQAPRRIIKALPGANLKEMPRNTEQSFCCGAGGGHMFVDETQGARINQVRSEEAQSTGASIVATNCPFCVQMFEDGLASVEPDEASRAKPMDIAQLLELTVLGAPTPNDAK